MKTIAVVNHTDSHKIFYNPYSLHDERAKPYVYLREEIERAGCEFHPTFDAADCPHASAVLSLCRVPAALRTFPKERCFLCVMEPPVQLPGLYHPDWQNVFGTIFVFFDDLADGKTYVKYYHHQARERVAEPLAFEEKKFCIMIQSNLESPHPLELYSERRKAAAWFPNDGTFDLFGSGWEGFANWRGGYGEDKQHLLKQYKFMLCYENMHSQKGFVTERIFEAFYSSTVPVYWGSDTIAEQIPGECFIDRRQFASNAELHQYLLSIDKQRYEQFLEAARQYLASEPAQRDYSPRSFGRRLVSTILERIRMSE